MLYTIGHSNVSLEHFIEALKKYNINILCDIRIIPYSSYVPHFNKDVLSTSLKKEGIIYVHKTELGSTNIYPLLQPNHFVLTLLEKINNVSKEKNIVFMSDGWDYKNCHRTILAKWMEYHFKTKYFSINIKDLKIFKDEKITQLNIFN